MRYRVDALAAKAGMSVDTVRFYQSKGLLAQPEREGRVAWYSDAHLERLKRVRDLKDKGFTLGSIRALLEGEIDDADRALVAAVLEGSTDEEWLTLEEMAERTGVTPSLLEAIAREGLLVPRHTGEEVRYSGSDVSVVRAGLQLLETGLPLSELLALAREHDEAMRKVAARAVEMFLQFVRDPIMARAASEEEAAEDLVGAFRKMLPATASLVGHHFERVLLAEAEARIREEGNELELSAVRNDGGEA